ncbi:MAG: [NiFe]-hydrogenase assembly chaperone HybE [Magnetococcales bacterium]|nr:[NiFe]-hydrogenase assembly chaperone HybE [Magnetococcales bacterium]
MTTSHADQADRADALWVEAVVDHYRQVAREAESVIPELDRLESWAEFGVEARAFRRQDSWRMVLILAPWMLCRLLQPVRESTLTQPPWTGLTPATGMALGPVGTVSLMERQISAHLQSHPALGRFLIQPLISGLTPYATPDDAFHAWSEVIRTREKIRTERGISCQWQQSVSRREMFGGLFAGRAG